MGQKWEEEFVVDVPVDYPFSSRSPEGVLRDDMTVSAKNLFHETDDGFHGEKIPKFLMILEHAHEAHIATHKVSIRIIIGFQVPISSLDQLSEVLRPIRWYNGPQDDESLLMKLADS